MSRIILGISGSIAACKSPQIANSLVKLGHDVRVILTAGGARFVTATTMEAITNRRVGHSLWEDGGESSPMEHIDLAHWGNLLVVAPCSANTLARLAAGMADDLLATTALSSRAPLLLAPAMESQMYSHPATVQNLAVLTDRGARTVGPVHGRLASGAFGLGRMSEPEDVVAAIRDVLTRGMDLAGLRVLVTAGPTHEPIDPVRYIGNRSSGKMGYAVAREAARRGADVILVSGPTALDPPPGVTVVAIETAAQLLRAVLDHLPGVEAVVMAAAVADFAAEEPFETKRPRQGGLELRLSPTEDVAASAARAAPGVVHVGFALESEDLVARAQRKMERKGLNLVVANEVSPGHNPFGSDRNRVTLIWRDRVRELPEMAKNEVARVLWDEVLPLLKPTAGQAGER